MVDVQLRSLRVSAEMDASSFAAGARSVADASRTAGSSVSGLGAAITQTEQKLSTASDGVERLKRQFLTGYSASVDFERGLATVRRGLEGGKLSIDQASVAIENLSKKYGQTAASTQTIVASSRDLGTAVAQANARILAQSSAVDELAQSYKRMAAEARAAQSADAAQTNFNRSFGFTPPQSGGAADSASFFAEHFKQQEEAARQADAYAQKASDLRAALDPVAASQARLSAEVAEYAAMLQRGDIATTEFAQAQEMAQARHEKFAASVASSNATVMQSYLRLAAAAREGQAQDNSRADFDRFLGVDQSTTSASASASVFEEQFRMQEAADARQQELARLRAQQDGGNFTGDLNSRLGIDGNGTNARASADVFAAAAREADMYAQKADALKAILDPIAASQARLNTELAEYGILLNRREIDIDQFTKAETLARAKHDQFVASLEGGPRGNGDYDRDGQFRRQNMMYQAFDISGGLASGQSLGMIAAQQAPQILQEYAAGGIASVQEDLVALKGAAIAAYTAIGPIWLALGAVTVVAGAYYLLTQREAETTEKALKGHQASIQRIRDLWGEAAEQRSKYGRESSTSASFGLDSSISELEKKLKAAVDAGALVEGTLGGAITRGINDNLGDTGLTNREFRGTTLFKKLQTDFGALQDDTMKGKGTVIDFVRELEEIGKNSDNAGIKGIVSAAVEGLKPFKDLAEALRDARIERDRLFNDVGQNGFLLSQGATNQNDMGKLDAFQQAQQVAADRAAAALRAQLATISARSPQDKADAARASAAAQYNDNETPAARAVRIETAALIAQTQAENTLKQAKEERLRQSESALAAAENELSLVGKTVAEQNRLRAEYQATAQIREIAARDGVAADEAEIAAARAKAAQIAQINGQVAAGKLLQDQNDQLEQLRLEGNLIGATAEQRARATAGLQAEQQMRQQGIDLLSREAEQYKANAVAMASARLEIERQNAAYASAQQAGGQMIDGLVTGTGTLKERLKGVADQALQWFQQMAVANPLKNALTGTNLPTLGDLFSGKPMVPGATATSTAMMNVTASVVNLTGGLPGLPGLTPGANTTLSGFLGLGATNGVRPDLNAAGIINSPVASNTAATSSLSGVDAQVWNYWAAKGLPPHQIAGIMGNIKAESNFQPGVDTGDNGNAWGLAQWNDRRNAMVNSVGPDWKTDVNGQMDFMAKEFATTENSSWRKLTSATDVRSATAAVAGYERPSGYTAANPEGAHNFTGRLDAANASLQKFGQTTSSAGKDINVLGDTSLDAGKSLTDALGATSSLTKAIPTPTQTPLQMPTTPTSGGFNPLALITSLFGLFKFADGTDFAPGGMALVGERGPELVNLPRGSQVRPNHKLAGGASSGGQRVQHTHEWNVTVSGNGDKELMERMRIAANESVNGAMTQFNYQSLPGRVHEIMQNPRMVG